ncbi:MAG: DUF1828 domain-containing protein [Pseudomonadota bacterium]
MSSSEIIKSFGFDCIDLPDSAGNVIHCINTPFQYFDGNGISIYAEKVGEELLRFFDAGTTIFHMAGSGIHFRTKRCIKPIEKIVNEAGASLSDDGEISYITPINEAAKGFGKTLNAIINIANWESENVGISSDITTLVAEVEMYLRQINPKEEIQFEQKLNGISGRDNTFDFLLMGELIDVVSSHPQSTAAEVKKLADIRGVRSQMAIPIKVIIDDRINPQRASQEALIISRFADVLLLTNLFKKLPTLNQTIN